ncbi:MAG: SGNH/GDSL hydrolase family protein [Anaerolineae bacterium]|nr:SGNH/GDSL hydrolase family protein [Anaerolineae bacterium]
MKHTLQLTFPLGQTLALALLILAGMSMALEISARSPQVEQRVPTAIGSRHADLDVKFGELDYLVEQTGRVDCVFLGSSVVNTGIDPAVVANVFRQQTDTSITCYNFGINGITAATAADLADLLIERYHPRVLVYGFTLRALGTYVDTTAADSLADSVWFRYQQGEFTLKGWFIDHSVAFQRYLALRRWSRYAWQNPIGDRGTPTGFVPYTFAVQEFVPPPFLTNYAFSDQQLAGLDQIVAMRDQTPIILLELPAPPHTRAAFRGGVDEHRATIQQIADRATSGGVPVWLTSDRDLIPENGWSGDVEHMNRRGAALFSQWLGGRLAEAFTDGELMGITVEDQAHLTAERGRG